MPNPSLLDTVTDCFNQRREEPKIVLKKRVGGDRPALRRDPENHFEPSFRRRFRTELLEGSNNWPAIMKALDDVGYTTADNWATIEMGGGDAERMKKLSGQLDRILAS